MPILSSVLLSTDGPHSVRVVATDLYMGAVSSVAAQVKQGGSVALPARTFQDIVRKLPEGEVHLAVDERRAAEIRAGRTRYRVPGASGDDFPPLPSPAGASFAEVDATTLLSLLSLTSYAMSSDDTRPHLAGALLKGDGKKLHVVATDGHRLSKAEARVSDAMLGFEMLVPRKAVHELERFAHHMRQERSGGGGAARIAVATAGPHAFFRSGDTMISVKLGDDKFPPYDRVIPKSQERVLIVGRQALCDALTRMSLVSSERGGAVRMTLSPGTLRVVGESPEAGEGSEELDVDYAGTPLTIGFNARYLLEAMGPLDSDRVRIELAGELDPAVVRPEPPGEIDFVGVIMPMRT